MCSSDLIIMCFLGSSLGSFRFFFDLLQLSSQNSQVFFKLERVLLFRLSRPGTSSCLVLQLLHVSLHLGNKVLQAQVRKHKSEFTSQILQVRIHKSDIQLMSSKSSQVNNLALGGYSGVRFFFPDAKATSHSQKVSSSKSSQVNNLAFGGYSHSRSFSTSQVRTR